ncbi:MAG: hypothetical protein KBA66_10695 [Leptospiraceae bacterium]|nr:hypothetical protein [Leptospiraceae bacterium]
MRYFILILIFISTQLFGSPLTIGDELRLLDYETQQDEKVSIPKETKTIVFTSEMEASKIAHEVFENLGDTYLKQKSAVFISDINRMPFLITKFVALPKMRSYKYTIHLIKDEGPGLIFPKEKGKLTVISLNEFKITSIQFVSNSEELKNYLEKKNEK